MLNINEWNDKVACALAEKEGFDEVVEKLLNKELAGYDYSGVLKGIELVMTQLGVCRLMRMGFPERSHF